MRHPSKQRGARARHHISSLPALALGAVLVLAAGCSSAGTSAPSGAANPTAAAPALPASTVASGLRVNPPTPDPRVGLAPGTIGAGEAAWNMRLVRNRPTPPAIGGEWNSDLAFLGDYVFQGNFNGFVIWDVSDPTSPVLLQSYLCPASQSDVSVFGDLLFVSSESTSGRLDCGTEGPQEPVSPHRLRGIRIFDITDIRNPRYIHNVQSCRGSHTHTLVTDPNDDENVYIYISGSGRVRPSEELPGCSDLSPEEDPNSSLFRVEVIRVPVDAPQNASIVTAARVFEGLEGARRRGDDPDEAREGPNQCHDITAYPEVGLAGGACQGYGILVDISDPSQPRRISAVADTNFATWHSVTFNNAGTKVLWTDEWGGGTAPRCRADDNPVWGANALFDIVDGGESAVFRSYYKMPAAQTEFENCVAHNGSLVPVPGRDIKVQGWYQGGVSVFDWTDSDNPVEIAFFDRGPIFADRLETGGSWSAYWYNGYIYSSEIARGLDVFELLPSGALTENELAAAKTVQLDYFNAQEQQRFTWPPSFPLARAYLDQIERSGGLAAQRISAVRAELARAEGMSGSDRSAALAALATQLEGEAGASSDAARARLLARAVRDLAGS